MKKMNLLDQFRQTTNLQTQLLGIYLLAVGLLLLPVFVFYNLDGNASVLAFAVLGGWGVSVLLIRALTQALIVRPLKKLVKTLERFEQIGEFSPLCESEQPPEFNRLCLSFNLLAQRLHKAEKQHYAVIDALMHELCTPVTVLKCDLEMLQKNRRTPTIDLYDKLVRQTELLTRFIEDMQSLTAVERGCLSMNRQSFSIQQLLQESRIEIISEIFKSSCQVRMNCLPDLPNAFSDPDWVRQILTNLISNAIRYAPDGTVDVRVWAEGRYLWVSVTDTGIGIAPDELTCIFEPFWRSPRARRLTSRGSGIGLAVVQRLVVLQGGQVEVESDLERGSMFRFSIPLAGFVPCSS
ncbi:HAMP domain-containing sensor histidine kinase [Leptolyngbya sp. AN03gr2]|uniref:HAMP domain-containing sensor histidine kinase n=1 Tax=unclassified Leptolyngbya TaxID=2650499 RepID=UPI003D31B58F